ncbi:CreA family protein [Roseospira visakhapatnamensis]|uniref:CreA protein n=1 Tax=Roseospira visakhapatnamensis TaxID=390880 RepID=A0A7W6W8G4_9PROT|nr:CreA family protein [Roseospira visakhapatnamensis]MBB4264980.1 CreA protein [Roseospira visakhapatnamensis]
MSRSLHRAILVAASLLACTPTAWAAEEVGCVDTVFKLVGPNHKICVDALEDPKVEGVVCHLSRPETGGLSGAVGLAEDPSNSAIACRQVGPITILEDLEDGEVVFSERRSVLFKRMRVRRFHDEDHNVLIYLVISDKLVEGSPKHSLSTVPIMPWRE